MTRSQPQRSALRNSEEITLNMRCRNLTALRKKGGGIEVELVHNIPTFEKMASKIFLGWPLGSYG